MYNTVRFIDLFVIYMGRIYQRLPELRFVTILIRNKALFTPEYKWSFLVTVKSFTDFVWIRQWFSLNVTRHFMF